VNSHSIIIQRFILSVLFIFGIISCSDDPNNNESSAVPSEPRNVKALPGNQSVTLTWDAPLRGQPSYYKIDVRVDNQTNFTSLDSNFTSSELSFIDTAPSVGLDHIYRVIAVNEMGDSAA